MGHRILWNPAKFIDTRKAKDFPRDGYWFSLWSSILIGLTVVLINIVLLPEIKSVEALKALTISFGVAFSSYYVINVLLGYLTKETVTLLKKEISFNKAFASIAYSLFLVATGIALTTIVAIIPLINILAPLISIIFVIKAYGIYIRFLDEYSGLNVVEAFVVSLVIILGITIGAAFAGNIVQLLNYSTFF